MSRLRGLELTLAYDQRVIVDSLTIAIPDNSFTVIRRRERLKEVARRLGLLPQGPVAPDGITVADLVGRGRYPHQGLLRQWSGADQLAVGEAMAATNVADLAASFVDELSGGQRQRVWLAMALAQQTSIMLLDEPTTFSTSPTRSTSSICAPISTSSTAARWSRYCTI